MGELEVTVGSLHNLPIKINRELYLLCLIPQNRTGCFVYNYTAHKRCVFTIDENINLDDFEVQLFKLGGILEFTDEDHNIQPPLLAEASRITQEQYEMWDQLRIFDRITLQIQWAKDAVGRAENDLQKALETPYGDPDKAGRWNTFALFSLVDRIAQATAELDGLYVALSAL